MAITRARRGVVVVGDPETLGMDENWRAFLVWCQQRGVVMNESELLSTTQEPESDCEDEACTSP